MQRVIKSIIWQMLQATMFRTASDPTLDISFINGSTFDPRITFTRASIGTYFDASGAIQTAASGAPRIGYDPSSHAIRGLLMENSRINRFLNSGTPATQSTAGISGQPCTLSFYGTGTIVVSGAASGTLVGSGAFPTRSAMTFNPTTGTITMTLSGSIDHPQLENGPYATSYIPTGATAVTRAADSAILTNSLFSGHNAGSIAVECFPLQNTGAGFNQCWLSIDDGTVANVLKIKTPSASSIMRVTVAATGSAGAGSDSAALTRPGVIKSAVGMGGQGGSRGNFYTNGANAVGLITLAQPYPLTLTRMGIGTAPTELGCDGYIRRARYWPRQLYPAELIAATT